MADIDEAKVRAEFEALALSGYFCLKFCPTRIDWTKGNSPVAVDDLGESSLIHEWIGYLARARHEAAEIAALKARIVELEARGGEPVAWWIKQIGLWVGRPHTTKKEAEDWSAQYGGELVPLYLAPPSPKLAVPEPPPYDGTLPVAYADGWNACLRELRAAAPQRRSAGAEAMSRMTDEELQALWRRGCDDVEKDKPIPVIGILRAIESAAYERAAQVCDARAMRAAESWDATADPMDQGIEHGCDEVASVIRAMKEQKP